MEITMEIIPNRIKKIRQLKQRSIHDCAKLLGISKEDYLNFEEGRTSLCLPELELLALFLEIPPEIFIEESNMEIDYFSLITSERKQKYIDLRNKMVQARLASERVKNGLNLEDLSQEIGIPFGLLRSYEEIGMAIPLDHLMMICKRLNLSIKSLLLVTKKSKMQNDETLEETQWQPEFLDSDIDNKDGKEELYKQIIQGIKSISEKDQAEIVKLLLEKLKD